MKLKSFFALTAILFFAVTSRSQSKAELVRTLNQKAEEAIGIMKIVNSKRFIVDGASVEYNGDLLSILFEVDKERYFYEFNPAAISQIVDGTIDDKSSIGVLVITLNDQVGKYTEYQKKSLKSEVYQKKVYFNYLKKDRDNFFIVKNAFEKLADICKKEADQRPLKGQLDFFATKDEIWTSEKKESVNYKLTNQYVLGCHLYLFYSVNRVTLKGDISGSYLTVIPLSNISDLLLMKKNTRPESLFLEADKNGFLTYESKGGTANYTPTDYVEKIPLFIKNSNRTDTEKLIEVLNKSLSECKGSRLRLKVID